MSSVWSTWHVSGQQGLQRDPVSERKKEGRKAKGKERNYMVFHCVGNVDINFKWQRGSKVQRTRLGCNSVAQGYLHV